VSGSDGVSESGDSDGHPDERAMLAAFDRQIRRHPQPDGPDARIERDGDIVRVVPVNGGWAGVVWTDLDESSAPAAIAAQVARFAPLPGPWEWKHYSYDRPADLPDRLIAAGFTPEPVESLLIAEVAGVTLDVVPPAGVRLVPVTDRRGIDHLVRVHDEVFGGDHTAMGDAILARLAERPGTLAAVVAMAGETPIAGARIDFHRGTEFASLWGGGTLPAWRGRGVFRALVAHRVALAAAAGYRYLQVDASADSRPILLRLGFRQVALTTPFVYGAASLR
jgi:GNAT superfamily N-acetyltransferase